MGLVEHILGTAITYTLGTAVTLLLQVLALTEARGDWKQPGP